MQLSSIRLPFWQSVYLLMDKQRDKETGGEEIRSDRIQKIYIRTLKTILISRSLITLQYYTKTYIPTSKLRLVGSQVACHTNEVNSRV